MNSTTKPPPTSARFAWWKSRSRSSARERRAASSARMNWLPIYGMLFPTMKSSRFPNGLRLELRAANHSTSQRVAPVSLTPTIFLTPTRFFSNSPPWANEDHALCRCRHGATRKRFSRFQKSVSLAASACPNRRTTHGHSNNCLTTGWPSWPRRRTTWPVVAPVTNVKPPSWQACFNAGCFTANPNAEEKRKPEQPITASSKLTAPRSLGQNRVGQWVMGSRPPDASAATDPQGDSA